MLSGNDAQAYMLTMSSGYTTKVKNVTWVGSCKSFCIILEFIQVVLVSELSIVASRSHLSIIAFPTVVRLWKGQRGGESCLFLPQWTQGAQSNQSSSAVWQPGAGVVPWMQSQEHEMVKRGHAVGKTCTLHIQCPLALPSRRLPEGRKVGLIPPPTSLICAGCFWIVQEQSQLRGLAYGNRLSPMPLVLTPVHLCSSVLPASPLPQCQPCVCAQIKWRQTERWWG